MEAGQEHRVRSDEALRMILNGSGTITIINTKSGKWIIFRLTTPSRDQGTMLVRRKQQDRGWSQVGTVVRGRWTRPLPTAGSPRADMVTVAFQRFFERLAAGPGIPDGIEIWRARSCGRCGGQLTASHSIREGIGPYCQQVAARR